MSSPPPPAVPVSQDDKGPGLGHLGQSELVIKEGLLLNTGRWPPGRDGRRRDHLAPGTPGTPLVVWGGGVCLYTRLVSTGLRVPSGDSQPKLLQTCRNVLSPEHTCNRHVKKEHTRRFEVK